MPVLFELTQDNVQLLVYEIEFDEEFYKLGIDFTSFDKNEFNAIINPLKRIQWLASRYWVKKLSKQHHQLHIEKTELGKPHFTNFSLQFSISHSRNLVAVICSDTNSVAIDLETIQNKILKIKHKFIHPTDFEQRDNLERLTMIWSAKETIYKHYHAKELYSFKEQIAVESFTEDKMNYRLSNFQNQKNNEVFYKKIDEAILTWIIQ